MATDTLSTPRRQFLAGLAGLAGLPAAAAAPALAALYRFLLTGEA